MNIKIMLNKDEEIKRLASDPEVEIKIKAAIVDEIAKRAATKLAPTIDGIIEDVVVKEKRWGTITLTDKAEQEIRRQAEAMMREHFAKQFAEFVKPFIDKLNDALNNKFNEIKAVDPTTILTRAAEKLLKVRIG